MVGTIYKITNNVNQKIYIGQTIQKVKRRWKDHCCANNKTLIHKAIKKYGKANFTFEVLEENIPSELLSGRELFYILKFNSTDLTKGYNQGEVVDGVVVATEAFRKIASDTMRRTHQNPEMKIIARNNGLKRRGSKIGGTSKYVGVSLNRIGTLIYWRATSSFEGKAYNLGSYKTEEEAAQAYNKFALEHFGENAVLNILHI